MVPKQLQSRVLATCSLNLAVLGLMFILSSCSKLSEPVARNAGKPDIVRPLPTASQTRSPVALSSQEEEVPDIYSLATLKDNYKQADVVVHASVDSFVPDKMETGYRPYTGTATVLEVFKGKARVGDKIIFREVLEVYDKELDTSNYLGEHVYWLKRWNDNGVQKYGAMQFMVREIDYDLLENLRKIGKSRR